jgi:CheY-like chemotaxis protein
MIPHAIVADPKPSRCAVYAKLLSAEGLNAVCVNDGAEACAKLRCVSDVRFLITELSLPRVDGFEVIRQLQALAPSPVPTLVVSAFREMRETAAMMRVELGIGAVMTTSSPSDAIARLIHRLHSGTANLANDSSLPIDRSMPKMSEKAAKLAKDSATDPELQRIVERVARRFGVPVALVSLFLEDKQWFKARVGLRVKNAPLDASFCRHVVEANEAMIVPDAHIHPTFANSAFVRKSFVRGYAGAPLVGADGQIWGTLCIIDPVKPITMDAGELKHLALLADEVVAELESAFDRAR